jgi:hypothetical protein
MVHFKFLEKQELTKSKTRRLIEIVKIMVEINEIETKQMIQKINETKS